MKPKMEWYIMLVRREDGREIRGTDQESFPTRAEARKVAHKIRRYFSLRGMVTRPFVAVKIYHGSESRRPDQTLKIRRAP